MVNNRLTPQFIALVILSSCLPCTKLSAADKKNDGWGLSSTEVGAIGVSCLLVAGLVIYSIKNANERSKAKADQMHALKEALEKSTLIVERHGTLIDIIAHDSVATQNPASLSETSLHSYAPHFKNQRSGITSSIAELSSSIRTISEAIARAHDNNKQKNLKAKLQEQKELKEQLEIAQECIKTYESFCNLDTMQARLSEKHARAIKLLESHPELQQNTQAPTISPALKPFFNTELSLHYASSGQDSVYLYSTYAQESGRDIQQVQEILKQASNYPKLFNQTQDLAKKLTALHHIVINSPDCHNERASYEKHQKEQQEFKLKQEHYAKIEQIQRAAAQTQAEIQRDILKEEQARHAIKSERLKIAQELPNQVKALAASQATLNSRMSTVETQQQRLETRQTSLENGTQKTVTCLDNAHQASQEEVRRLKANLTQVYTAQNHQANTSNNHETRIKKLETFAQNSASEQSAAQKKQKRKTIITEEPVGPAKADEPVGPGA